MDTQTRHALKQDKFALAAASSADWISGHRAGLVRWVIAGGVLLVLLVAVGVYWNVRTGAAESALGAAMDVYTAPLTQPGAPAQSGEYSSASARSQEANRQFTAIAHDFSMLPEAAKAHYFAGITDIELGQNGAAETELKTAADAWDKNVANLAKVALAGLYHQTSRDSQAIAIYNEIIAKPSTTVSAGIAQLDLADLYVAEGKQDQAKSIWAKLKDADKTGVAGSIAAQKLTGNQ